MAVLVGVHPGGKGRFAVSSLYWSGKWPALAIGSQAFSGVHEVLNDIVGTGGEWGEMTYVAIDAPLTWSGCPSGWRDCDKQLMGMTPRWAPGTWLRAPNALPGAVAVQGPALAWALAREIKQDQLPKHGVAETHPRLCWSAIAPDLSDAILGYRDKQQEETSCDAHRARLLGRLVEPGMVRLEGAQPTGADELDALMCALVALGVAFPETGLVVHSLCGGDIRPVGDRRIAILRALP